MQNDFDRKYKLTEEDVTVKSGAIALLNETVMRIVPESGKLLFIADKRFDKVKIVYDVLTRKFRTDMVEVSSVNKKAALSVSVGEDVKAVVCAGGGGVSDMAKYVAARHNLPLVCVALSQATAGYLIPSAMLEGDGGYIEVYKVAPPRFLIADTALFENSDRLNAAGFGEVCSRLTAIFDWQLSHVLKGEEYTKSTVDKAVAVIGDLLYKACKGEAGSAETGSAAIKLSLIASKCGNSRLMCGGDAQLTHAFSLLCKRKNREVKLQGENEMLFSCIAMRAYLMLLARPLPQTVSVPDNNARLDYMSVKLGVSPFRALDKITDCLPYGDLSRMLFILREYRAELTDRAVIYEKTLSFALKLFKRLYKDKGYSYNNYLSADDVKVCIALAPEMREKFTCFTLMKQLGLLDGFLRR